MKTNSINNDLAFSSPSASDFTTRYFPGINSKTFRNFKRSFPTIDNEAWYENEFAYIAKFSSNGIATMVAYGKNSSWHYTIRRYQENSLPKQVRFLVKSTYFDYMITGVDEVNVPQIPNLVYILRLREGNNLKTVRVNDGEIEVIAEFHE